LPLYGRLREALYACSGGLNLAKVMRKAKALELLGVEARLFQVLSQPNRAQLLSYVKKQPCRILDRLDGVL
jgi:hypothetical protein